MTAEEARKKTEEALKNEMDFNHENFYTIYNNIDFLIEDAAENGKCSVVAYVDGCDESWECVYYKRDKIMKHYEELGYKIENKGYDRYMTADEFIISWD